MLKMAVAISSATLLLLPILSGLTSPSYAASCVPPHQGHLVLDTFCWPQDRLPFVLSLNTTATANSGDDQVATLRLGLHENKTGQSVSNVSYIITLIELESNQEILTNVFYAERGILTLKLYHDEHASKYAMSGARREPVLNAFVPVYSGQPIAISSSEIGQNKTYNIHVEVLGFDNIRNLIPPDEMPKADFVWNSTMSGTPDKILIVPEFGSAFAAVFVMAAAIASAVAAKRLAGNSSDQV